MTERAWIWREETAATGHRKPRPSSRYGPLSAAHQQMMLPSLPGIPRVWQDLPADDPDVLLLFRRESLSTPRNSRRRPPAYMVQPFSLHWFLAAERLRYGGPGRWIPRVLEFGKHAGETLLSLGRTLGTDAAQFARSGARVIVCNNNADELQLIRRNFYLRDLTLRSHHAPYTHLPLEDGCVDVVQLDGLLHEMTNPALVIQEVFRVLKPGGKVVAVVPARPRRWQSLRNPRPLHAGLGSAELKRLFLPHFVEHRRLRRHMRRREIWWGYRWLPKHWLEHCFGRYWILKAFKPVNVQQYLEASAA
ncbi:MAG TPA: class I SAM-dependent methyltransferase [Gemmatales bacterium]|nr:class I SAM-dependent methyltransferase [Gemmatales bacterium]